MTMDVASTIDPELAAALEQMPGGGFDWAAYTVESVPMLRAAMEAMPLPEPPPLTSATREVVVPGATGFDPTVRVYTPHTEASGRPCVYWIHGGGYMVGSGLRPDPRLDRWVDELDCVVVSIEYRLAPEHGYPAPLDDCYAGLLWAAQNADELGIDPRRIMVAGASAGGGLAAGLAILARDRGEVSLAYELLTYPMLDDTNTSASSRIEGTPVWSRAANELGWRAYLGDLLDTGDVPVYAAPTRVADVTGLPPAWIGVGTLDLFRDEDIAYASRLLEAGIPTELHVYPGAVHAFEAIAPDAALSRAFDRDIVEGLRRAIRSTAG